MSSNANIFNGDKENSILKAVNELTNYLKMFDMEQFIMGLEEQHYSVGWGAGTLNKQ